jgi:hypothetical protein
MDDGALRQVREKLKEELVQRPHSRRIAILGLTPSAFDIAQLVKTLAGDDGRVDVYTPRPEHVGGALGAVPVANLETDCPDILIVASDDDKEELLLSAMPYIQRTTKIIIGGFRHFEFRDSLFNKIVSSTFVPSFANGYPNTLVHLYQCLRNAARLQLKGVVAEFGMFKGGTTMLLSRFTEALGQDWKIFGFDTFDGFPAARSVLDMYSHPDCVYLDLDTVRRFFEGRNVEVVPGDVVETVKRLQGEDVVLAFVDTDNHTSAAAILEVILDRIVLGGAIVFDHFTGRDRFLYTLGERIAAKRILGDPRYFNLHDTGVFLRQR